MTNKVTEAALVEKVARAICLCRPGMNPDKPAYEADGSIYGPHWQTFVKEAEAAIAALSLKEAEAVDNWQSRIAWAEKTLAPYASGDKQTLLDGYSFPEVVKHVAACAQHLAAPVSTQAEAREAVEPIAWRWRDNEHQTWNFIDFDPVHMDYVYVEPLYAAPVRASALRAAMKECADHVYSELHAPYGEEVANAAVIAIRALLKEGEAR